MLVGRLLWGAAWAGIYLGATTVIFDVSDNTNRGFFVGRLQMWFFIGVGISSLAGGLLFDAVGYAPTFMLSAIAIFTAATLWLLFLPETRRNKPEHTPVSDVETGDSTTTNSNAKRYPVAPLVVAILLHGLNWLVFIGAAFALFPVLLEERIGLEVVIAGAVAIQLISFTGMLSAFNTVISLLSSPLSGWLSDRTGNRWRLVVVVLALGVVSLSLMAAGEGIVVVLASMLNAIVNSVLITQLTAVVGDYTHHNAAGSKRQGHILGIMNTVGDIGGTAGPILAFAALPVIGLAGIFTLSALSLAIALPATMWIAWREQYT